MLVIFTTIFSVNNRYKAIEIVIVEIICLYNFFAILVISSVIIIIYLAVSFLSRSTQFSVITILGIVMTIITIIYITEVLLPNVGQNTGFSDSYFS
jgi:hypothetical protein